MVRKLPQLLFLASLLFFSGCIPFRKVVLFQKNAGDKTTDSLYVNQDYEFVIAPFDLLNVKVVSTVDEVAESLGVFSPAAAAGTGAAGGAGAYLSGTLVDKDGNIKLPYIGNIKVAGLTLEQASDTIRSRLSTYILDVDRNLLVTVKILNFSVNVLGEVGSQGVIRAENEYLTVTEVLAKAGGVTDLGNRENIKLIRTDRLTKKTTSYRIDLTTQEMVSPQLARLQPNDVLYVQPLRRKQFGTANQLIGLVTTFISIPLIIFSLYNVVETIRARNSGN
jgi:polysaccharide export outer membrane protein